MSTGHSDYTRYFDPDEWDSRVPHGKELLYDFASSEDGDVDESGKTSSMSPALRSSSRVALLRQRARRTRLWNARVLMLSTFISALAFCVFHHFFLTILKGKNVEGYSLRQTWVRDIGNAVAHLVQILLEVSVGVALTQSIWFYVRRTTVTLTELDDLFSLPSITSFPSMLIKRSAFYVLPCAIVIQAFSFVGIIAPNALSVQPAGPTQSIVNVPYPSLAHVPVGRSVLFSTVVYPCDSPQSIPGGPCGDPGYVYLSPSPVFKRIAESVLTNGVILPWSMPAGCGLGCNYTIAYSGPSLRCTDVPASSIAVVPTTSSMYMGSPRPALVDANSTVTDPEAFLLQDFLYNSTTTLGQWTRLGEDTKGSYFSPARSSTPYAFELVYATNNFSIIPDQRFYYSITGTSCAFYNATYNASVVFANGSQMIAPRVVEYGEQLTYAFANSSYIVNATDRTDAQFQSAFAALGLVDAMSRFLSGNVAYSYGPDLVSLYTNVLNSVIFTLNANNNPDVVSIALSSSMGSDMGRALENLCTNLTASLMSDVASLGVYKPVQAMIRPDETVYYYQVSRLWLVYGVALIIALVADTFGLACMRANGAAMERSFTSIAASLRTHELDELLSGPSESRRVVARAAKLRYRATGSASEGDGPGFKVVKSPDNSQLPSV